jgi:hypothetical protein
MFKLLGQTSPPSYCFIRPLGEFSGSLPVSASIYVAIFHDIVNRKNVNMHSSLFSFFGMMME